MLASKKALGWEISMVILRRGKSTWRCRDYERKAILYHPSKGRTT